MKVYNNAIDLNQNEINDLLGKLRVKRNFVPHNYLKGKSQWLNDYINQCKLNSCVVAVSGGIDSAVVLGIVHMAMKQKNSPIKKIFPVFLPTEDKISATNQNFAFLKAKTLCETFNLELINCDITVAQDTIYQEVNDKLNMQGQAWAKGQLTAYTRTPFLYYMTSLCNENGYSSVICGTTNRDEGAYLGYVGKASDGMVDIQLISDTHKSEVYQCAHAMKIPQCIIDAIPTGDMYDGRSDEEVFGTSYDFVELFLLLKDTPIKIKNLYLSSLSQDAQQLFYKACQNIEKLHKYNAHKYIGNTPSVHFDIYDSAVEGGWKEFDLYRLTSTNLLNSRHKPKFIGEFYYTEDVLNDLVNNQKNKTDAVKKSLDIGIDSIESLLSAQQTDILINGIPQQSWTPVGKNGVYKDYHANEPVGSWRASTYDEELAQILWHQIKDKFDRVHFFDETRKTDTDGISMWKAVGINPLFRFIKYEKDGKLVAHYDAPVTYHPFRKTLKSVIFYLTSNQDGATRFIEDEQFSKPIADYNFEDKEDVALLEDVNLSVSCDKGNCLIFDHRLLHDSEPNSACKIIMRTDIIFEALYVNI